MNPFAALLERLRRREEPRRREPPPPLPADMSAGAEEFQAHLDEARERLRREIPPPVDEE